MKTERRTAIYVDTGNLKGICIFRGKFLEGLFLDLKDVESKFLSSSIKEEVMESNFGFKEKYIGELETICNRIVSRISERLNTIKQ
jgi:Holliday junction resolvase